MGDIVVWEWVAWIICIALLCWVVYRWVDKLPEKPIEDGEWEEFQRTMREDDWDKNCKPKPKGCHK